MNHLSVQELSALLDGALAGPALDQVTSHLTTCHACRDQQARLAKHDDALRRLLAHDPNDRFMDELARRSEALVVAIARGLPAPPFATSMPLADEEPDTGNAPGPSPGAASAQHAAAPAGDPAPAATETGYGRIGMRPTASTEAPGSDPEFARRLLEEIDRAGADAIEGFELSGTVEPRASDSGPFKPPGWSESAPPAPEEPREAERPIAGGTGAAERPVGPARAGRSEPAALEHSGLHTNAERSRPGPDPVDARPARVRPPGFGVPRPQQPAWERLGLEPDPFSPGVFRDPLTGASIEPPPLYARRPATDITTRRRRPSGAAVIAALATVGGLLVLVLVLRTSPAGAPGNARTGTPPFSLRLPRVEFVRRPAPARAPAPNPLDVRDATTRPPADRAVPSGPAASPRLCGQVVDSTGTPLAGVLLTVDGSPVQVQSDGAGHFCLTAPAGPHVVRIQGQGTPPQRITLEFAAGAPEFRVRL